MPASTKRPLEGKPRPADLTIAVCTIGRPGYLQESLRSLLRTTPAGVALSLVMNAPDDADIIEDVRALMARWDGPSNMVILEERVGIAASHNTALEEAATEFITFMGDDDLVLEPRVERLLDLFWTIDPTPAVIGSFCRRATGTADEPVFTTNKDYGPTTVAEWKRVRESGELIEIVFPTAFYRTERLRGIGGFEDRFGSAMDLATFTILGQDEPVIADPRRSFAHRIHDGSVTSSQAGAHAARLRYAAACIEAIRASRAQPTWETFVEHDSHGPIMRRATTRAATASATLFRQGGAAVASGRRLSGAAKIAGSMMLSPGTFLRRSRAQLTHVRAGEPVVTILVKNCNHYRVPFYGQLRQRLRDEGIELRLVVADGLPEDAAKGDQATLSWAESRPLRTISLFGRTVLWQPGFDHAWASDLVITEQASKQLFNIALAYGQRQLRTRLAFWGHGRNFQSSIEGEAGESLKRRLTAQAHWFFAYNDLSAEAAVDFGMAPDRITAVMNSTDTTHLRRVLDDLPAGTESEVRTELGMGAGAVGLFLGGLYPLKRPAFLIDAARLVRERLPDFELLVIGDGSERAVVVAAAAAEPWIHHVGAVYGDDRVRLASLSSVQLSPGAVGLNIVDAFALGVPTVTIDLPYHGPEIGYLEPGRNGEIVRGDPTPADFADTIIETLTTPGRLDTLQRGAAESGQELSIERMVERFADGVVRALAAPTR